MTKEHDGPHPLVVRLYALVEPPDRAALAALRNGFQASRQWDALRLVLPYVSRPQEDDALLLGALFGLHPQPGSLSVAQAMRRIWRDTERDSVEGRFSALLAADREDLPQHLRHSVGLIAGHERPLLLDWDQLFRDIRFWTSPFTRRRWAREFWAGRTEPDADSTTESATTPKTHEATP